MPLSFSAISILCITLLSKTKNFYVLQCDESTTESLLNEKSYNLTLTYVASLREFIEYRVVADVKFAYTRHRNTRIIERVTKRILTNTASQFRAALKAGTAEWRKMR